MISTLLIVVGIVLIANLALLTLVAFTLPVLDKGRMFCLQLALDIIQVWRAVHQARIDVENEKLKVEANERGLLQ